MLSVKKLSTRLKDVPHDKVVVLVVVLVLTTGLFLLIDRAATATLDSKRTTLRQEQARLLQAINAVPSPVGMVPGIANSQARYIINTSVEQAETANEVTGDLRYIRGYRWLAHFSRSYDATAINRVDRQMRTSAPPITQSLSGYANLLSAMGQFIEYNPSVDTEALSLGSSDSNERMERLRQGLSRAETALNESKADAEIIATLLALVERAKTAQTELEAEEDVEAFVATFEALQREYIEHITAYYQELFPRLRRQTVDIARLL